MRAKTNEKGGRLKGFLKLGANVSDFGVSPKNRKCPKVLQTDSDFHFRSKFVFAVRNAFEGCFSFFATLVRW